MIMQIMRGSYIRIGVKNNSNCGIGNTEIAMFLATLFIFVALRPS